MSYTDEQLKKMLLPDIKIIAKELGIPYTRIKKADLIQKILDKQQPSEREDDILSKAKRVLKKYIKLNINNEDASVKKALNHLATELNENDFKKIEKQKDQLKTYIKETWKKYEEKEDEIISKIKQILKKYINLNAETLTVNSALKHLSSKLTEDEYKRVETHKKELKQYIEKTWEKEKQQAPVKEKKIKVVKPKQGEDLKKYTIAQLKDHLKNIGVTESLKGRLKADILRYTQSDRCYPEKNEMCSGENEVCDLRNNLCVLEKDIPSKGLKKYEYNGYTIYGTKEQLSGIQKMTEKATTHSVDVLTEDSITDTMISFIKTTDGKISNIKLLEHLKNTFALSDSLKKIEEKFYPFLKALYSDVKKSNIGYECVNGICSLTRDKKSIKYSTIEECKKGCKKQERREERKDYFACVDNKCVAVPLDEAEFKTNDECRDYCLDELQPPETKIRSDQKKIETSDDRLIVRGEQGITLQDIKTLEKPKVKKMFKVEIEETTGEKTIIHGNKKIAMKSVKEPEKPKLVKELDSIMYTGIFYDNEIDKRSLAIMKCLGLIMVS
jgi:hypothetical protein